MSDPLPDTQIDNVFASHLIHQLDLIKEQSESGLYVIKRAAAFLKKIASHAKHHSISTVKACQHEAAKDRARMDGMNLHVQSYIRLQESLLKQANAESDFADSVISDVVDPMTAFFKEADKKRLELVAKHLKLNHKLESVSNNVTKNRNVCLKLWKEVQAADQAKNKEASKNSKKLPKAEKHFRSCRQKAVKAFQSFEQLLVTSIADQKRHWEVELPELIEEFEKLEVGRMTVLKTHLSIYAQLQVHLRDPLDFCIDTAFETSDALNPREDLAEFVREKVQVHQMPPPVEPFKFHLPCSAAAIEAGSDEFFTTLNQDCDLASQSRQKALDAQESVTIDLPDNRDSVISISRSVQRPSESHSATAAESHASAAESDAEAAVAGAALSHLLQDGSDSEDASDKHQSAAADSQKSKKSKKKKKKSKTSKKAKVRRKKSRADSQAGAEESPAVRKSLSEGRPQESVSEEASDVEEEDTDSNQSFDLKAALKEDRKIPPLWLVVANFDFQPGDSAEQDPKGSDDEEESDNEDLAFNKGDWLRVTHKQQHDSDEEDTEEDDSDGEDMWWRGYHCRMHGGSERGIFPSNYVSVTAISQDNPSLHVWVQKPSAVFTFSWAMTKYSNATVSQFVDLWNDIELFRKLECRHLRDKEEEIDRSNLVLQGLKIVNEHLRPMTQPSGDGSQKTRWDLPSAASLIDLMDAQGEAAVVPRMFDPCSKEMVQILSSGFELVRKKHPEILVQLSTVYAKSTKT